MTVRVRGIYATALTELFDDVVQASPPIERRFDEAFPVEPATVTVETTEHRQGVGLHGDPDEVASLGARLEELALDAFRWRATLPRGAVYAGEITETLGSGALVDCGVGTGFLPYARTGAHVEVGDRLRVQVREPRPPWANSRPVLDTTIRVYGELGTLVRGGLTDGTTRPDLADILPAEPPDGWAVDWGYDADDAGLEALSATIEYLGRRAGELDDALSGVTPPAEAAPVEYFSGDATTWVWFGRGARFALDDRRRRVVPTMAGHHRIKAGANEASTAVDLVEAVCDDVVSDPAGVDEGDGGTTPAFPFDAVTRLFGPTEGETVRIGHGKPDGSRIELGSGTVTSRDPSGRVTVERELRGGGTYDALGVAKEDGDVATTKFTEGRWWYPTVYRSEDGVRRGTYVNVCTPVEVFPREVRYVDLHVDVIERADGSVAVVDEDELDEAVSAGHVSDELADRARTVARAVENALSSK